MSRRNTEVPKPIVIITVLSKYDSRLKCIILYKKTCSFQLTWGWIKLCCQIYWYIIIAKKNAVDPKQTYWDNGNEFNFFLKCKIPFFFSSFLIRHTNFWRKKNLQNAEYKEIFISPKHCRQRLNETKTVKKLMLLISTVSKVFNFTLCSLLSLSEKWYLAIVFLCHHVTDFNLLWKRK